MSMYNYDRDKKSDRMLFYDQAFTKDVQVRFLIKKDDSRWIALIQEPDRPFETAFVRELIPESEFETRQINSRPIREWLDEKELK